MKDFAVKLTSVSKKYIVHHEKPTLVENILKRKRKEEFFALKNINLTIQKGERLGIIGPNGSGKTTLLKIIAGITIPTTGSVKTNGRVVSLIELGAGFQQDLTGEENILLNGLLIGMKKEEIINNMKNIIEFAEIGSFIDAPFYTYSSGMALRLGFSIAVHANPDILLLDENMTVGDKYFNQKSHKFIQYLSQKKCTIILVSHSLSYINYFSSYRIYLKHGKVIHAY
jgi:ABC-type polysaccharide/polyol phosphate transport system ATPase subunit